MILNSWLIFHALCNGTAGTKRLQCVCHSPLTNWQGLRSTGIRLSRVVFTGIELTGTMFAKPNNEGKASRPNRMVGFITKVLIVVVRQSVIFVHWLLLITVWGWVYLRVKGTKDNTNSNILLSTATLSRLTSTVMAECNDFQIILLPVASCSLHDEAVLVNFGGKTTAAPLADWHGSRGSRPALAETADFVCRWSNTCEWHYFRRAVLDVKLNGLVISFMTMIGASVHLWELQLQWFHRIFHQCNARIC